MSKKEPKITIIKQTVNAPSRKLSVKWSLEEVSDLYSKPPKKVADMTEEEQADEIVRRLSQPYRAPHDQLEDDICAALSAEICKEMDRELIERMKKLWPKM